MENYKVGIVLIVLLVAGSAFFHIRHAGKDIVQSPSDYPVHQEVPEPLPAEPLRNTNQEQETNNTSTDNQPVVPLSSPLERITKKPFGIYIDPKTSPIQPERFQGFHTGTDFEIFENELDQNITVNALCPGKIIEKKYIGGYGGTIVQSCELDGAPATILYGHIDLGKSQVQISDKVEKGQPLAALASEKSYYSAGERKHLHLGIHRGSAIDYRGYVQTKKQLESWIDFETITEKTF